jgi:hypothetical protein
VDNGVEFQAYVRGCLDSLHNYAVLLARSWRTTKISCRTRSFEDFPASPTLRDMIDWCIEKPNEGVALATDSEAMKALEAYITGSNKGSPAQPSRAPGAAAPAEAVHSLRFA